MLDKSVTDYMRLKCNAPFFYVIGDDNYDTVREELKQSGIREIRVSDYCRSDDKFPDIDSLMSRLTTGDVNYSSKNCVLIGLGEYLSLRGVEVAKSKLRSFIYLNLGVSHLVILLRGVGDIMHEIAQDTDFKMKVADRYYDDGSNFRRPVTIYSVRCGGEFGLVSCNGVKHMLHEMENGTSGEMYVRTSLDFSASTYRTVEIKNSYGAIRQYMPNFPLSEELGDDAQWDRFYDELREAKFSPESLFDKNGYSLNLESDLYRHINGNGYGEWLFFVYLKYNENKISDPYIRYVVQNTKDYRDLKSNVLTAIIDVSRDDKDFKNFYDNRKRIVKQFPGQEIRSFIRKNSVDMSESIYRLTDNTILERREIVSWVSHYGVIPEIAQIYPDLGSYLKKYTFSVDYDKLSDAKEGEEALSEKLTRYFETYKEQKVKNEIYDDFVEKVPGYYEEIALKLDTKSNILRSIQDEDGCFLCWIDALGVEYLAYIVELARENDLNVDIRIGRAILPSTTEFNRDFYDNWKPERNKRKVSGLDEIKHGESSEYDYEKPEEPVHLADELKVIREAINGAAVALQSHKYKKYIVASDHGASRLAVVYGNTHERYKTETKGEKSGRCCDFFEGCDIQPVIQENGHIVLSDYGRFEGSRASLVEVHGGASLEEVLVPVITLTLKNFQVEYQIINPDKIHVETYGNGIRGVKIEVYISHVGNDKRVRLRLADGREFIAKHASEDDDTHYEFMIEGSLLPKRYDGELYDGDNHIGHVEFEVKSKLASEDPFFGGLK